MSLVTIGLLLYLIPVGIIGYSVWFYTLYHGVKYLIKSKFIDWFALIGMIFWFSIGLSIPLVLIGKFYP